MTSLPLRHFSDSLIFLINHIQKTIDKSPLSLIVLSLKYLNLSKEAEL
jgi:hypothetical protein